MERTGRKGVEYRWIRRDEKKRSVEGGVERHERRADDGKGTPAHSSTRSSAMAKEDSTRIPVNLHPADTDDVLTCTTKHADLIKADSVKRIRGHFEDLLRERGEGSARRSATLPCHLHYSPTKGSKASEVWFGSNQRPKKRFGIQRFRAAAKIVTAAQKMETVEMKERRQNGISTKTILLLEKIKKRNADKEAAERNAREEAERAARAAAKEEVPPFPNLIWNVRTSLENFVGKEEVGGAILDKVKNLYTMLHSP